MWGRADRSSRSVAARRGREGRSSQDGLAGGPLQGVAPPTKAWDGAVCAQGWQGCQFFQKR